MITWDDFAKVDIRVGRVVQVDDFPRAKKPAYQLRIDFGDLGIKTSSAQITKHRSEEHTSELQSLAYLVCRLLLEKKKNTNNRVPDHLRHLSQHTATTLPNCTV